MSLYHYCSNSAFFSIVTNKTVRLSYLPLSNDFYEGNWIQKILRDAFDRVGLSENDIEYLTEFAQGWRSEKLEFGLCLSEEGDLLSQWRGYAEDGQGMCIGFNQDYLEKLCEGSELRLVKMRYEYEDKVETLVRQIERDKQEVEKEGVKIEFLQNPYCNNILDKHFMVVILDKYYWETLKNPAFGEEKEGLFFLLVDLSTKETQAVRSFRFSRN